MEEVNWCNIEDNSDSDSSKAIFGPPIFDRSFDSLNPDKKSVLVRSNRPIPFEELGHKFQATVEIRKLPEDKMMSFDLALPSAATQRIVKGPETGTTGYFVSEIYIYI